MSTCRCISCEDGPIEIKKHKLCSRCYQRWRRLGGLDGPIENRESRHEKEIEFAAAYGGPLLYEPVTFKVGKTLYTPDFYDAISNLFIEVAGTRQAYSANKKKYEKFKRLYPKIPFVVIKTYLAS